MRVKNVCRKLIKITSNPRKCLWLLIFVAGFALSLYQTLSLLSDFLRYPVNTVSETTMHSQNPSITICANDPLAYQHDEISTPAFKNAKLKYEGLAGCSKWPPTLYCLSLLPPSDRFDLGHNPNYVLTDGGAFMAFDGDIEKTGFNNLYYGNCVTQTLLTMSKVNDLKLIHYKSSVIKNFFGNIIAVIHDAHTPPVFKPENTIQIMPFRHSVVTVSKTMYLNLDYPYETDCVRVNSSVDYGWPEFFRATININQKNYSREFCLDQCLFNLTMEYCKCILPKSLIGQNTQQMKLCNVARCDKIPQEKLDEMCNCKPACEYSVLTSKLHADHTTVDLYQLYAHKLGDEIKRDDFSVNETDLLEKFNFQYRDRREMSTLKIHVNVMVKRFEEKASFSPVSLLNSIGGIWALWIGVSVLTFFELVYKNPTGRVEAEDEKRTTPNKKIGELKINFSLIALNQIYSSPSGCLKFLWTMTLLVGLITAAFQTRTTIFDFFNYKVEEIFSSSSSFSPPFPSITLCQPTQFYFREEYFTDERTRHLPNLLKGQMYKEIQGATDDQLPGLYFNFLDDYPDLQELLSPKVKDWVLECEYKGRDGMPRDCLPFLEDIGEDCVRFNGQTVTFNQSYQVKPIEMFLKLNVLLSEFAPIRDNWMRMAINSPGSTPFINSQETILGFAGDRIDVTFTPTKIKRLRSPYKTECEDDNADDLLWLNNFYDPSEKKDYTYTKYSCLVSCIQNLTIFKELCTTEIVPFETGRLTRPGNAWIRCNPDLPAIKMMAENLQLCNCKSPCKNVDFDLDIQRTSFVYKKLVNLSEISSAINVTKYVWKGPLGIYIRPKSVFVQRITEKPKTEIIELLAEIGGCFGLWLGASFLLIIETLCLFTTIVSYKFYARYSRKIIDKCKFKS